MPSIPLFKKQKEAAKYLFDSNWQGEVAYGGGARGGKSILGSYWIVASCFALPESEWMIGFEELKHLRRTTLPDVLRALKHCLYSTNGENWQKAFKLNQQDMVLELINGSKIYFAELSRMPSDPNFDRLGSYSLTGIWIDEAQRVSEKAKSTLSARLSKIQGKNWKTKPKALYTCNPSKDWLYREFYKPLIKDKQTLPNKVFIQSLYTDNPFIDHDSYKLQVLASKDKVQIERLLYGNFEYDDDDTKLMNYDAINDIFSNKIDGGIKCMVIDVARLGKDKTIIYVFDGWRVIKRVEIGKDTLNNQLEVIENLREQYQIPKSKVLADEGGVGGGIVDFGGYKGFVSNASPIGISVLDWKEDDQKKQGVNYKNLKTQCAFVLSKKVNDGELAICCDISLDVKQRIIDDLDSYRQDRIDLDGPLTIISKEKQKEILGRSPDDGDTLLMRSLFDLKPLNEVSFYI